MQILLEHNIDLHWLIHNDIQNSTSLTVFVYFIVRERNKRKKWSSSSEALILLVCTSPVYLNVFQTFMTFSLVSSEAIGLSHLITRDFHLTYE